RRRGGREGRVLDEREAAHFVRDGADAAVGRADRLWSWEVRLGDGAREGGQRFRNRYDDGMDRPELSRRRAEDTGEIARLRQSTRLQRWNPPQERDGTTDIATSNATAMVSALNTMSFPAWDMTCPLFDSSQEGETLAV